MSSNFFKSSAVVQEREVRIINSNDIVAKKLENTVRYIPNNVENGMSTGFAEGIQASEVEVLFGEEGASGDLQAEYLVSNVGSKADMQITSKTASDIVQKANEEAEMILARL